MLPHDASTRLLLLIPIVQVSRIYDREDRKWEHSFAKEVHTFSLSPKTVPRYQRSNLGRSRSRCGTSVAETLGMSSSDSAEDHELATALLKRLSDGRASFSRAREKVSLSICHDFFTWEASTICVLTATVLIALFSDCLDCTTKFAGMPGRVGGLS